METRVQKYNTYRASLIKEGSTYVKDKETYQTTNTLPLNEVMNVAKEEKKTINKKKLNLILIIIGILILIAIIVGIVFLGINVFKEK